MYASLAFILLFLNVNNITIKTPPNSIGNDACRA